MIEDIDVVEEDSAAAKVELNDDIAGLLEMESEAPEEGEKDEPSKESTGGGTEEDKEKEGKVSETEDAEKGEQESEETTSEDDEKSKDSGDLDKGEEKDKDEDKEKEKDKKPEMTEAEKLRARLLEFETISTEVLPKEETVKEEVKVSKEEVKKEEPKELFTDDEYIAAMETKEGMESLIKSVLGRESTPQQTQTDDNLDNKIANALEVRDFYIDNKDLDTPIIKKYVSNISAKLMSNKEYGSLKELLKDTEKTVRDNLFMPKVSASTNETKNNEDKKQAPSFATDKKTNQSRNKQGSGISEEQQDMMDILNVE